MRKHSYRITRISLGIASIIFIYIQKISRITAIYDSMELGRYYPHEIFITNTEVFLAYELNDLTKKEREICFGQ